MKKSSEMLWKTGIIVCITVSVFMCCMYLLQIFANNVMDSFLDALNSLPTFAERCVTTEDGFVYYIDDEIGLCILEIPDNEELVIPEYIDGHLVAQLGYGRREFMNYYNKYYVNGENVKKLTVQHNPRYEYTQFYYLETLVYEDIIYIYSNLDIDYLVIYDGVSESFPYQGGTKVELKKGDKQIDTNEFRIPIIEIPEYVVKIDSGVFDGLTGVTIKNSYESKPDGWEEGWNGSCEVIWGAELE